MCWLPCSASPARLVPTEALREPPVGERHGAAVSGGAPLQEGGWMTSGRASSDQRLG